MGQAELLEAVIQFSVVNETICSTQSGGQTGWTHSKHQRKSVLAIHSKEQYLVRGLNLPAQVEAIETRAPAPSTLPHHVAPTQNTNLCQRPAC